MTMQPEMHEDVVNGTVSQEAGASRSLQLIDPARLVEDPKDTIADIIQLANLTETKLDGSVITPYHATVLIAQNLEKQRDGNWTYGDLTTANQISLLALRTFGPSYAAPKISAILNGMDASTAGIMRQITGVPADNTDLWVRTKAFLKKPFLTIATQFSLTEQRYNQLAAIRNAIRVETATEKRLAKLVDTQHAIISDPNATLVGLALMNDRGYEVMVGNAKVSPSFFNDDHLKNILRISEQVSLEVQARLTNLELSQRKKNAALAVTQSKHLSDALSQETLANSEAFAARISTVGPYIRLSLGAGGKVIQEILGGLGEGAGRIGGGLIGGTIALVEGLVVETVRTVGTAHTKMKSQ